MKYSCLSAWPLVLFLALLVLIASVRPSGAEDGPSFTELQGQFLAVSERLASLENRLAVLETRVINYGAGATGSQQHPKSLEARVTALEQRLRPQ